MSKAETPKSRIVEKPWGKEVIFAETDKYVGKILYIDKGHKLSRQFHNIKDETFYVQKGKMILEIGLDEEARYAFSQTHNIKEDEHLSKIITMKKGDTFHCPPGTIHRMIAVTDVKVFEVSTPELEDVVRLEDDYNRV